MTPPFSINSQIITLIADISEKLGRLSAVQSQAIDLRLRRINQVRTIQGTLAIEGNELSEAQITAILAGKRVLAPIKEITEAKNAIAAYEQLLDWQPQSEQDLLAAHQCLMLGLLDSAGAYRQSGVGVMKGDKIIHMAPPASRLSSLMAELLNWLETTDVHPLIKSCVFHYEFEFIHPFADGNGRMGRLWQSLILAKWQPLFAYLPIESLINKNQEAYYDAINKSTELTDSYPFIEFMLTMIVASLNELDDLSAKVTPQVTPQVTPHVNILINQLLGEMSREELQLACQLKDRKSFSELYLKPALICGVVEMTIPEKPRSRLQRYRLTQLGIQLKNT